MTYTLPVTLTEAGFFVNFLGANFRWPMVPEDMRFLPVADQKFAGGPELRLKIIAVRRAAQRRPLQKTWALELDLSELWALDLFFHQFNIDPDTGGTLSDGTPIKVLAERVWDLLILAHQADVDPALLPLPVVPVVVKPVGDGEQQRQRDMLKSVDGMLRRMKLTKENE